MRSAVLLHGLLLAFAGTALLWQEALLSAIFAVAVACLAASALARHLAHRRFRTGAIVLLGAVICGGGALATYTLSASTSLPEMLGPMVAVQIVDAIRWASFAFGAVLVVRALCGAHRAFLVLEAILLAAGGAKALGAHRGGMIARPLGLSDPLWAAGVDPVVGIIALGAVAGIAAVLVFAKNRRAWAALFVLLVAAAFVGHSLSLTALFGADMFGGRLAEGTKSREAEKRAEQKQKQGSEDLESPFREDLPEGGEGRSQEVAAVVVFHNDVEPTSGVFYFRHAALSMFNGNRLVRAMGRYDRDVQQGFPADSERVVGALLNAPNRKSVRTDVALVKNHNNPFALLDPLELSPLANPAPARFKSAYSVLSEVPLTPLEDLLGHDPGDPTWTEDEWQHYTKLPDDGRYHELATKLQSRLDAEHATDPLARALVVKHYLEQSATYSFRKTYTGEDPTAEFLFSEEMFGYCVHLAHAASFLLRAMGVPARVSTGYAVPFENLGGGSALLVKASAAHAWAEVYLEGQGWVPIEVAPENSEVELEPFEEQDLQRLLGEMARQEGNASKSDGLAATTLGFLRRLIDALPHVFVIVLLTAYLLKFLRLVQASVVPRSVRARIAYRSALDRLSAIGQSRAYGESPEAFARRVRVIAPSLRPLTAVYVASTLGSKALSVPEELAVIAAFPREVGREVRSAVPAWRYFLGLLNPLSWLSTR